MLNERPAETDNSKPYDGNLFMLVDFLKFSWDLFIKGHAFYLFAISVMGGFAFSTKVNWFQKIFVGLAIVGASTIAYYATCVSLQFLKKMASKIEAVSKQKEYVPLPFAEHIRIVQIFRGITIVLFFTGVLYITHVLIMDGWWPQT
ncbi:MAG TPA: hypothetical protein ENJ30_12155 [Desulfobulbaceae bacterium]|nr:hypothetical protein [Desulfobulbaceae bacterium]